MTTIEFHDSVSKRTKDILSLLATAPLEEALLALTMANDVIKACEGSVENMQQRIVSQLNSIPGLNVVGMVPKPEDPRKRNPMPEWLQKMADEKDDDECSPVKSSV